jgi:hypothetical protein
LNFGQVISDALRGETDVVEGEMMPRQPEVPNLIIT